MTTCALLIAGMTAYSMLTHDGRRMVSHVEGTNIVYELVPIMMGTDPCGGWIISFEDGENHTIL